MDCPGPGDFLHCVDFFQSGVFHGRKSVFFIPAVCDFVLSGCCDSFAVSGVRPVAQTKKNLLVLSYTQILADTVSVTVIIYVTGSLDSIFTFLYLLIIIYGAMLVLLRGSLIIAGVSSIQYGLLIVLEYYHMIPPFSGQHTDPASMNPSLIFYRIFILMFACLAVAYLSGVLTRQLRRARQDLKITHAHYRRVEKMEVMDEMISGIAHEIKNPWLLWPDPFNYSEKTRLPAAGKTGS